MSLESKNLHAKEIEGFYDKKYSSYTALPYFSKEKSKKLALFSLIGKSFEINWENKSYLDLGCGLGITSYILSKLFYKSVGIDFSKHAIKIAELFNDNPKLSFKTGNIKTDNESSDKYDVITAFGLSIFNTPDTVKFIKECKLITTKYLNPAGFLIINSHSDFSGSYPTGWYCHSKKEISTIVKELINEYKSVNVFYPHKKLSHYISFGLEHFFVEFTRLLFTRRRSFFILIKKK